MLVRLCLYAFVIAFGAQLALTPGCARKFSREGLLCNEDKDCGAALKCVDAICAKQGTQPADAGPQDTKPADVGPQDTAPVDTVLTDTTPTETTPVDSVPMDTNTTEKVPEEPVEKVPVCQKKLSAKDGLCDSDSDCCAGSPHNSKCEKPHIASRKKMCSCRANNDCPQGHICLGADGKFFCFEKCKQGTDCQSSTCCKSGKIGKSSFTPPQPVCVHVVSLFSECSEVVP